MGRKLVREKDGMERLVDQTVAQVVQVLVMTMENALKVGVDPDGLHGIFWAQRTKLTRDQHIKLTDFLVEELGAVTTGTFSFPGGFEEIPDEKIA